MRFTYKNLQKINCIQIIYTYTCDCFQLLLYLFFYNRNKRWTQSCHEWITKWPWSRSKQGGFGRPQYRELVRRETAATTIPSSSHQVQISAPNEKDVGLRSGHYLHGVLHHQKSKSTNFLHYLVCVLRVLAVPPIPLKVSQIFGYFASRGNWLYHQHLSTLIHIFYFISQGAFGGRMYSLRSYIYFIFCIWDPSNILELLFLIIVL